VKAKILLIFTLLLFSACTLKPHREVKIVWPNNIQYIEALCELDLVWKDSRYSGSMSLILEYPDKLLIDVFGPFGDTVFHMQKDVDKFIMTSREGSFYDEGQFEDDFGIKMSEFIDDLTNRNNTAMNDKNSENAKTYKIRYNLDDEQNNICWEMKYGNMCITFLEAKFSKQ